MPPHVASFIRSPRTRNRMVTASLHSVLSCATPARRDRALERRSRDIDATPKRHRACAPSPQGQPHPCDTLHFLHFTSCAPYLIRARGDPKGSRCPLSPSPSNACPTAAAFRFPLTRPKAPPAWMSSPQRKSRSRRVAATPSPLASQSPFPKAMRCRCAPVPGWRSSTASPVSTRPARSIAIIAAR